MDSTKLSFDCHMCVVACMHTYHTPYVHIYTFLGAFCFLFFETGSHYVVLAGLGLSVDQANLELTEIHLPLPPKCWN